MNASADNVSVDRDDRAGASPFDAETPGRRRGLAGIVLVFVTGLAWASTGIFVVGADESAVVRVCGKAERTSEGGIVLRSSGLYFHCPWPFAVVDRIRINEVRTVTVGDAGLGEQEDTGDFLQAFDPSRQSQLLTGDRNVLNVQLDVNYRVLPNGIERWLYSERTLKQHLESSANAVLADVVLQCGVDFVHTLGHNEIRQAVLKKLQELVSRDQLGVEIGDVTIAGVTPPIRVKSEFVDVMNARADRETYINRARAYEAQRLADARADATKVKDKASAYARREVDLAQAEADSFHRLIDQFEAVSESGSQSYEEVRQLALRRHFIDTLEEIYRQVNGKVVLDTGKQVDLTIHRNPNSL